MPYTADQPPKVLVTDELKARIPGWGVDLDPADRPSVPRERRDLVTGAHWEFPDRQEEKTPRERSIEHLTLPPVYGTTCPPKGIPGVIRRRAYTYSEARAAHWLLLILADRADAVESHVRSFATARPDNPVTESGVLAEFRHHPVFSRKGRKADLGHVWMDPVLVFGPWVAAGGAAVVAGRALAKAAARRTAAGRHQLP
ncbi:hypothetical protein V1639_15860 [Pseudarthrobacter sp. J75]|uniref:hypothetical protein n=1 Tax=unclassified Pseudarthrobacter TaxID=2647000 RepID=UPI002E823978|nr:MULTISPECIES: hypothetical protein [unclassified Pseudarthrobacter]MEE2523520.1 hypothetical protein [Pseudarthrobacter sp. J47]MEE2530495.1 hypothetical protein [Pseudarthrobacter sp. J75]